VKKEKFLAFLHYKDRRKKWISIACQLYEGKRKGKIHISKEHESPWALLCVEGNMDT